MTQTKIDKNEKQISMVREFDAPIQMVWDTFTSPDLIAKWWGPRIFNTTVKEMDVRPGGVFHYCMQGTVGEWKGVDACAKSYYLEVKKPELLVYRNSFVDSDGNELTNMPEFITTFVFKETNGKTTMTMTAKFSTLEELSKIIDTGFEQGMGESLDKLQELLAKS